MQRALELAANGLGRVSPNPLVGCVIVHDDTIIGEGWHEQYGSPHAEVNAIHSVKDPSLLPYATLYVNLEPCSHHGKTPPCADLIVEKNIGRVVIANGDPNPLVTGRGIRKLQESGIAVEQGVLEQEGRQLNRRFFTFMEQQRPYIILKWAQTQDGFIARENFDSKWISNELSRKLVHKWRAEEDAVMVGTHTALYDNPRLNVRDWEGRDPVRIVVDKDRKVPVASHLFDQSQSTLCYNAIETRSDEYNQFIQLDFSSDIIPQVLKDLHRRKVQSVIVEGGARLLTAFITGGWWDEARIFTGTQHFGNGIAAPDITGQETDRLSIEEDTLQVLVNAKNQA